MSVKLMARAWDMDIPSGQKMVLLALCDHANDEGVCYPSQDKLAAKCSMSSRSVISHIKWLEERGIVAEERRQSTQRRKSDLYQIDLDAYSEPENFAGSYKEEPPVYNHQKEPSYNNNSAGAFSDFAAKFAMRLDWQPADLPMVQDRLRGNGVAYGSDLWRDALADFAEYWAAQPQQTKTAAQWDAKFIQSAREVKADAADRDIKIAVVQKLRQDGADWGGKPDAYIQAAFDLAVADADKNTRNANAAQQRADAAGKPDNQAQDGGSAEAARAAMIAAQRKGAGRE